MKDEERFSWDYALERNTINIFGVIDTRMSEIVISQLQYLDDRFKTNGVPESERTIVLQINSPGGEVTAGLAIYDTIRYLDANVATVGLGLAASMGAFLLSSGTRGMRRASANCEVLIHQPLGGAQGKASDIIIAANHIARVRDRLNRIIAENTGKPLKRIQKDTDRDTVLTAEEAVAYGLIDTVIPVKRQRALV